MQLWYDHIASLQAKVGGEVITDINRSWQAYRQELEERALA